MRFICLFLIVWVTINKSISGQNIDYSPKKVRTKNYLKIANKKYKINAHLKALHFAKMANLLCNEQHKSLNLCGITNAKLNQPKTGVFYLEKAKVKANELGLDTDTININLAILNSENKNFAEAVNSYSQVSYLETDANLLFARGNAYFDNGDISNAIEDYKNSNLIRENKETFYNLGLAYFKSENYSKSLENLKYAKSKGKNSFEVYLAIAIIYQKLNENELAEYNLKKAYRKNKNNIETLIGMANLNNKIGKFHSAIGKFNKALSINKSSYTALCGLGISYIYTKNYPEAKRKLQRAIKIEPTNKIAYVGMGNLYSNTCKYIEAIDYFRKALEIEPNNLFAIEGLGIAYFHLSNYEEALSNLNYVRTQNPAYLLSYDALISQGYSNYYLDKLEEAQTYFEEAIKIEPKISSGLNGLALVCYSMKRYNDAIYYFSKSIRNSPKNDIIFTNRGNAYYKLEKYKKAKQDFNAAILLNPLNEHAYNGIGISETACGNYAIAVKNNEKAIGVASKSNKDLYMNLIISRGHLLKELYKTDSSLGDEQFNLMLDNNKTALSIGLDPSVANINLGFVNGLIGKYDLANQYFDEIADSNYLMFVQNNKGVIVALKEKSYSLAFNLFTAASEINRKRMLENKYIEEYTAPAINIRTIDRDLDGENNSRNRTPKSNNKNHEKYTSTYFYYDLMRLFPHPTDLKFQFEINLKLPQHTMGANEYLLYNSDSECFKTKTRKVEIKSKKIRRKKAKAIKILRRLNCPKF